MLARDVSGRTGGREGWDQDLLWARCCCSFTPRAIANGDIPVESVPGSCNDFNKYLAEKGAGISTGKDGDVKREPGRAGVTRASYRVDPKPKYELKTRRTADGRLCVNLVYRKSPISIRQPQRILMWRPSQRPSDACIDHVKQWREFVVHHEEHHFQQNLAAYNEHVANWTPLAFEKFGPDNPAARDEAIAAIQAEGLAELQQGRKQSVGRIGGTSGTKCEGFSRDARR